MPLLNSSQTLLLSLAWHAGGFAIRLAAAFIPACSLWCCDDDLPFPKWVSSSASITVLLRSSCDELCALVQLAKVLPSPLAVAVQLSDPLAPS